MKAILIVSHGSHSPNTKIEVSLLVDILHQHFSSSIVEFAFLEIESPNVSEGIDICAFQNATQIVIALNFLNSGRHVDEDIPAIVQTAREKYPQIQLTITKPVGQHPKIPNLFIDLINET